MYRFCAALLATLIVSTSPVHGADPDARGIEFFEKKIRPVLTTHCYSCHSRQAAKVRGELLLDTREGLLKGGESGPVIVPGHPEKSLLIRALRHSDELKMPPKDKLPDATVEDFARWITMGAPDPRQQTGTPTPRRSAFRITEEDRNHWAFRPVARTLPPKVRRGEWCASPLDAFILATLESRGLPPSEPADRHVLLRRATFDLTGLPPTPQEIGAFVADKSPEAFERVVDRLLASKAFGERWARHWLDGVRYASDVDRSGLYRDWVVRAFNDDMPYDRFVRLQVAADLLPNAVSDPSRTHVSGAAIDDVPATGMLALAVWERVARDLAVAEIVDSQIDVVSRQLLGVTLACARCHDHKFDPFSTEDYYALAGVFFSSHISPGKLIADGRLSSDVIDTPLLSQADAEKNHRIDGDIAVLNKQIAVLEAKAGAPARLANVRAELKKLSSTPGKATGTTTKETQNRLEQLRAEEKRLLEDQRKHGWKEEDPELTAIAGLRSAITALEKAKSSPPSAITILEGGVPGSNRERIGDAAIYLRGDHRKEGAIVPRRFPVLLAGAAQTPLGKRTEGSGRLELAEWIASPKNPLTARVMVNRVWQHLFGQGIVRTPDNFGRLGERPTHPELLDYLAGRFIASGWSVKRLIRDIMLSSVYRQSSFADADRIQADPENRLLGRMSRKRLEYEAIRDSLLFVSGQLAPDGKSPSRRTLYEPIERGRADAMRSMFDGADPLNIVPVRANSTNAPQALFLLNSPLVAETVKSLARRVIGKHDRACVANAYLLLFARPASEEELQIGVDHVARNGWERYLHVLLCTNEFLYVD